MQAHTSPALGPELSATLKTESVYVEVAAATQRMSVQRAKSTPCALEDQRAYRSVWSVLRIAPGTRIVGICDDDETEEKYVALQKKRVRTTAQ